MSCVFSDLHKSLERSQQPLSYQQQSTWKSCHCVNNNQTNPKNQPNIKPKTQPTSKLEHRNHLQQSKEKQDSLLQEKLPQNKLCRKLPLVQSKKNR